MDVETRSDQAKAKRTAILRDFWADESGATAIEYALIAGGIVLVIIPTIYQLGGSIMNAFYDGMTEAFGN